MTGGFPRRVAYARSWDTKVGWSKAKTDVRSVMVHTVKNIGRTNVKVGTM